MIDAAIVVAPLPSRRAFAAELHSTFRMQLDAATTCDAEMVEFTDSRASDAYEQFALTFLAPPATPPLQKMYQLDHPRLGSIELLLVPIGRDARGVYLQAAFNRLLDASISEDL